MAAIADHNMFEEQATLTLSGSLEEPWLLKAGRSGKVSSRGFGGFTRQESHSLAPRAELWRSLDEMAADIPQKLARFKGLGAELKVHGLIRRRRVAGVGSYHQEYRGFWGSLRLPNAWDSVFGGGPDRALQFRRGPWEEWSPQLPKLAGELRLLPMVMSPFCATILHEAVGHAMEAEYLADSPLRVHLGGKVSCEQLTVMDRPDLTDQPGSMTHDDTGAAASQTTLIHRGFLVGDLDHERGVLRRGSFRDLPQVRASNFMVKPGAGVPDEWLKEFPECYYVAWIRKGNWVPGSQKIKLLTGPLFHIVRGVPVAFLNWTFLEFSILNLLGRIEAVGQDFRLDPVVHWCLKKHQAVPMGMGMPSILLRGLQ